MLQTAMIIDDDADLCTLLAVTLEDRKIYSLAVQSLPEAEECLAYMKPSIIFLDNNFPEGLGINLINTIRSAGDGIKIIMMTADDAPWIKEKALASGVDFFLRKPFSDNAIDNVLNKLNLKKA
jgi:DNA-binding response OmpR family regulator